MATLTGSPEAQKGAPPLFRVVRGKPSDEETAALTIVLVAARAARARAAREADAAAAPASNWASHARALGVRAAPGPAAWRRSALPG
jgi:Acyl-CoA carboxylase epsilon subunit